MLKFNYIQFSRVKRGKIIMKKRFHLVALLAFIVGFNSTPAFSKDFPDVSKNHWAIKEIKTLEKDRVVVGYPDGYFKPDQFASRAEFATMIVKALKQENCNLDSYYYFKDVPKGHWAFEMVEKAAKFDLIPCYPSEYFKPLENITRLDAYNMMVASVETSNISDERALAAVNGFVDTGLIPQVDRVNIGKAKILGIETNTPDKINTFEPNREITRAEISYSLYNMRKQALQRPNSKLAEAMRPKYADGYAIDPVYMDGTIATIPAGTLIPASLVSGITSQTAKMDNEFYAVTKENIVTKDRFFLIPKKSLISGTVVYVRPAKYFVRNAELDLGTQKIAIYTKPKANFAGNIDIPQVHRNWYQKVINFIIKGTKISLYDGQDVFIKLSCPIKIDITNQTVLDN